MTARWPWPWTPAPMSAARGARPSRSGAKWRIATPEMAAVRTAVIGPPLRIAAGAPVSGSLMTTIALIAGSPRSLLVREPGHPFDADQVARTVRVRAAQIGRHGVHEGVRRASGGRRSWAAARHRRRGRSWSARPGPGARRWRASPRGRPPPRGSGAATERVPETRDTPVSLRVPTMAYDARCPPSTSSRASTT